MKQLIKLMTSRLVLVGIMIIIQLALLVMFILRISEYMVYFYALLVLISIAVVLLIISKDVNPSYKLAWVIPILAFPVLGGSLYLFLGIDRMSKRGRRSMEEAYTSSRHLLNQDENTFKEISSKDRTVGNQTRYLSNSCSYPAYKNTLTEYYPIGEKMFESLKSELKRAEKFIFLEYFIIEEGLMWNSILDILKEKVAKGVEVRVIYDDVGCINKLPYKYNEKLKHMGIACRVFNPFVPLVSIRHNNRDHRKIAIIDGNTAFCGGINLADEYINHVERFGHWKDTAIMLKGEAVWSFTVMFLQMWNMSGKITHEYEKYMPTITGVHSDGYVQPYGDNPGDNEIVGEQVYINIISKARDYVYISTPYFVVDNEILSAITLAGKSGVDVRIILPHIPDKPYVHAVAKSHYSQLLKSGVRVYEYTPGFNHSKTFVSDDQIGTVGTVNLDYRSLYLHFECGVWLYKASSVMSIKEDFLSTLRQCHEVTLEECSHVRWYSRLIRSFLKAFAPLM